MLSFIGVEVQRWMTMVSGLVQTDTTRAPSIPSSLCLSRLKPPKLIRVKVPFSFSPLRPFLAGHLPRCRSDLQTVALSKSEDEKIGKDSITSPRTHEAIDGGSSFTAPHSLDEAPRKTEGQEAYTSSIKVVTLSVCAAVAFGVVVGLKDGVGKSSEFFAGYILEQSLSVDNLFVFILIFKYFKVPLIYQNRVLSYGFAGAIIFRFLLIALGTATLQRFEAVNLVLAGVLLYSSFKLFGSEEDDNDLSNNFIVRMCQRFVPVTSTYDGNHFITKQDGLWKATPLLLTVAVIELSDIAFAVDSIPAVFGVTRDPFIVLTSNIFAILGLRSLYVLISGGMSELEYLQPAIAVVLGFIGFKMVLDFSGFHISTEATLSFVATSLAAGVLLSLRKKSR